MEQEIVARIRLVADNPFENPIVIVRKVVFKEDGAIDKKYGLSRSGEWIEVPEAQLYPLECYLLVSVYKVNGEENGM